MQNKRIYLLVALLAALAVTAIVFIGQPKRLAVGFQAGAINYPMMHALDGGFFEREGLKPEARIFQSANDAQDALLGGSIFLDSVIPIQNIAAIEAEKPGSFGIIALLLSDVQHPLDFLVVPSDSPVKDPRELAGKTIVVFPGTYSETVTKLAFAKLGVADVKFLKLPPAEMPQALQTGRADAGLVYEPVATLAEVDGWGRILERGFWEKHLLPMMVVGGYVYNGPEGRKNPDLLKRTYRAVEKALADAKLNPANAKQPLVKYLKVRLDILSRLPEARVEMASETDPAIVKQTLEFYVSHGIIPRSVDLSPLLMRP
jgi:ABC-type nitrate/sulfonate/bicarbonate transport system substrate-binding protein